MIILYSGYDILLFQSYKILHDVLKDLWPLWKTSKRRYQFKIDWKDLVPIIQWIRQRNSTWNWIKRQLKICKSQKVLDSRAPLPSWSLDILFWSIVFPAQSYALCCISGEESVYLDVKKAGWKDDWLFISAIPWKKKRRKIRLDQPTTNRFASISHARQG